VPIHDWSRVDAGIFHDIHQAWTISPIFLESGVYVPAPLEATYQTTWEECPEALRDVVAPES
jgi:hypothetical protein